MWPRSRPDFVALGLVLACQPSQGETSGFTTMPAMTTTPASTSSSTASDSSGSGGHGGSTTSTSGAASTTSTDSSADTSGTTLLLDVGSDKDVGDAKPPGCKGKIDFLFVISRDGTMKGAQEKLIAAFPKFVATIESKFADFDFHIMVVDGDPFWGLSYCTDDCPVLDCKVGDPCCPGGACPLCDPPKNFGDPCCSVPNYPCAALNQVTDCDYMLGAGNIFAAGAYATNKPCDILGGRRFLTKDQPNLTETFACIAKLGISGTDLMGEALTMAMKPEINAPGGCNAGFLRDDALLMVTFIGGYDYNSKWDPGTWAANVLKAKKGDPGAVVMLSVVDPTCPPQDRICELVKKFPYYHLADVELDDYSVAFDAATDLVEVACAEYIPG